ncbi:MAG: MerR family transcriptional regulator [Acidobacteriota bacterium]
MARRTYRVGQVADLAGVTVRTLHHYDEIGLLVPSGRSRAGYRLYTRDDIERLQQIRFHRELGMPLEEIRRVLDARDFDARAALREHRRRLTERKREAERLIATIDRMLEAPEGDDTMSAQELFDGFRHEEHAAEAEERWGDTPSWEEARRRTASYGPEDWTIIKTEAEEIVRELAACREDGEAPDSEAAMELAEQHRRHIDRWYYPCSPEMHAGLAEMYVNDPRFAGYFDRHGEGLSGYVSAAIRANAGRP